ncbi:MAG: serine hydrolase [Bacteroidales bacterium]|jgi:CubicO group peptidase (beta-lactamase class C family)|nr:beta-lactamase family protein [Bacteroidales bacterium]
MKLIKLFWSLLILLSFVSCGTTGRVLLNGKITVDDYKIFENRKIDTGNKNSYFYEKPNNDKLQCLIPDNLNPEKLNSVEEILVSDKTVAFIIIRDDTIMYEKYFEGHDKNSVVNSFSVTKSIVSVLIGIAIEEGFIHNVNDVITDYIPELKGKGMDNISIADLLNMRSGIIFNRGFLIPVNNEATYFVSKNLLKNLRFIYKQKNPQTMFEYASINTTLLGNILISTTGKSLSEYLQEKIWQPLGMESPAYWSLDSYKSGFEKPFCCINAVVRDFARFGRLILNDGKWEGRQIVPEEWIKKCTTPAIEEQNEYSYHFWLFNNNTFYANGFLGQYVFINPNTNTIIVRIGNTDRKVDWLNLIYYLSEIENY